MKTVHKLFSELIKKISVKSEQKKQYLTCIPKTYNQKIETLPMFIKNRERLLNCGPTLWIYLAFLKKPKLTSRELYQMYLEDPIASSQNFFTSDLKRHEPYETRLSSSTAEKKRNILRIIRSPKNNFSGF